MKTAKDLAFKAYCDALTYSESKFPNNEAKN